MRLRNWYDYHNVEFKIYNKQNLRDHPIISVDAWTFGRSMNKKHKFCDVYWVVLDLCMIWFQIKIYFKSIPTNLIDEDSQDYNLYPSFIPSFIRFVIIHQSSWSVRRQPIIRLFKFFCNLINYWRLTLIIDKSMTLTHRWINTSI